MSQQTAISTRSFLQTTFAQRHRYQSAAVVYTIYGVVYLAGAIARLTPDRQTEFFGGVPWWVFYVAGGALVICLPIFIWKEFKWVTRILTFGPAGKALTLCWKQSRLMAAGETTDLYNWFFMAMAVVAAFFLFRAGWKKEEPYIKGA